MKSYVLFKFDNKWLFVRYEGRYLSGAPWMLSHGVIDIIDNIRGLASHAVSHQVFH